MQMVKNVIARAEPAAISQALRDCFVGRLAVTDYQIKDNLELKEV